MVASPLNTSEKINFELFDTELHGLRWGNKNAKHKVIALHGWLDNCASFSRLLPYVKDIDCIAIDLAGHGESGFRDGHCAYNVWEDLKDISIIADHMSWDKFTLLGHSRGAAISTLYAGTFPEKINGVFLIDGILPFVADESELPQNLAVSIREMIKVQKRSRRRSYFDTYEDAVKARTESDLAVSQIAAELLAERSVTQDPEKGYYWRYDQRLMVPSEVKLSKAQAWSFIDSFSVKARVIAANNGLLPRISSELVEHGHENVELQFMDGDHHLHVLDDESTRIKIAESLNEYLDANV